MYGTHVLAALSSQLGLPLPLPLQDSQVIRVSFSNFFKEFKSSATWLQFPFVFETRTPRRGDTEMGLAWLRKASSYPGWGGAGPIGLLWYSGQVWGWDKGSSCRSGAMGRWALT